ncbi:hypothetical protein [Fibrella aquatica]|uniref:hypothetical protein n=1 Tax=Fibrella aquatica TaxID=3242487 RepID=UPI00351FCB3C
MKNKTLFFASVAVVCYLLLLYFNAHILKFDYVLIGVLQELLTIPVMILLVVLLVIATTRIVRKDQLRGPYLYGSFSLLSISLVLVVSFFL